MLPCGGLASTFVSLTGRNDPVITFQVDESLVIVFTYFVEVKNFVTLASN